MARWSIGKFPGADGYRGHTKAFEERYHAPGKGWLNVEGRDDWQGMPRKPKMKELVIAATGKRVKVPAEQYNELVRELQSRKEGFVEPGRYEYGRTTLTRDPEAADYDKGVLDFIDSALDPKKKSYVSVATRGVSDLIGSAGAGHITRIEYNGYYRNKVMRVSFAQGAVVVYFNVPPTTAHELIHYAETGEFVRKYERGKIVPRHMLGIRFWDLVRIRGNRHGSIYPFAYSSENAPMGDYGAVGAAGSVAAKTDTGTTGGGRSTAFADWEDILSYVDIAEQLFPSDAVEDWGSLPSGSKGGSEEQQYQAMLHEMYGKASETQKQAIQRAAAILLNYSESAARQAAAVLAGAGVRIPDELDEKAKEMQEEN